jgi:AcrR family transcriptional regulator
MAMTSDTSTAPARRGPPATKHIDILWAAARLFSQRGVAQTTTRDIAAEAQTTERTLFKHFGNKEGLIQAVIAEAVLTHLAPTSLDALRKAIDAHDDEVERWHVALLQGRSQAMASAPELTRLLLVELLRDEDLRGRFAAQWLPAVWRPLQGLFKRLQREGRLRRDVSADSLARMFLSLNVAYLVSRHALAPQAHWDDTAEIAAIASLFTRGAAPG